MRSLTPKMWDQAYNNEPSLTGQQHQAAMASLQARESYEQARRAERVVTETKGLPMQQRVKIAQQALLRPQHMETPDTWDLYFDGLVKRAINEAATF